MGKDGSVTAEIVPSRVAESAACKDLQDTRIIRVVIERACGKTWGQIAAALNVDWSTLWRWRQEYPIDELAAAEAKESGLPALLKLTSTIGKAADVLCDHVEGNFDRDDMDAERLRQSAAVKQLGMFIKVVMQDPGSGPAASGRNGRAQEISTDELMRRARELRQLGKGGR